MEISHQIKSFLQLDGASKIKQFLVELKKKNRLPRVSEVFHPKNDSASVAARQKGNQFFIKDKDYVSALECYNRSICLAPEGSETLAIGYANRSAVYLNAGFYKYCLQNIEFALKNNYPEKLRPKLEQRRKECEELMNNLEDSLDKWNKGKQDVKLSYPADERIPIMIQGLKFQTSPEFGRHIVSERDLNPGDIILIEQSFSRSVVTGAEFNHCAHCLNTNYLNLLPCPQCTRAMFCSENCRQEGWKRFHQYECPIIDYLLSPDSEPMVILMRTVLQSFTMFDDPMELQNFVKDINIETETAFDLDYSCLTEKQHFRAIYALVTNEDKQSIQQTFVHATLCANAWYLLETYTKFPLLLKNPDIQEFFLNFLFRISLTSATSFHKLASPMARPRTIGNASFALCSLLNHSCASNVERILIKRWNEPIRNAVVVKRVIKAGDQIFDNYGPHHGWDLKEERQAKLKRGYNFECRCEACVNDYPAFIQMKVASEVYRDFKIEQQRLKQHEKVFAMQKLEEYKKFMKKNYRKYPSFKICAFEDNFLECMGVFMSDMDIEKQLKPLEK